MISSNALVAAGIMGSPSFGDRTLSDPQSSHSPPPPLPRGRVYTYAKSQVGSSSPQLTSKVHFPTPGEPSTLEVNLRQALESRKTRLSAGSYSFPGKPLAAAPGARVSAPAKSRAWRQGARERVGPSGLTPAPPLSRPEPRLPTAGRGQASPGSRLSSRRRRSFPLPRRLPARCARGGGVEQRQPTILLRLLLRRGALFAALRAPLSAGSGRRGFVR